MVTFKKLNKSSELIIAHRGESFDAPENTLASVCLAWERNVKSVEIDIRLTKDNNIVVFHDKNTLRISGVKKLISKSSLDELKHLDAGSHKGVKWKNERIPLLNEVINTVPEGRRLIIEIKSDRRILGKLKSELSLSNLKNSQVEVIAFDINLLASAKQLMPYYKMLWLLDLDYYLPWWLCWKNKKRVIKKVRRLKLDGVDVWSGRLLNRDFITLFKNAGLLVYAWTVNDRIKARELIESGIDGITTDRAEWLTEQIR